MDAMNFANQLGLKFELGFAFINDHERMKKYLKNELEYPELKKVSEDLFCFFYKEMATNIPSNYLCPQYDMLAIDQNCKVITCCGVNDLIYDKQIYLLKAEEIARINTIRQNSTACAECIKLGIHYIGHNFPKPNYIVGINK
jgi:hypothetical protein